jgi:hypothetical protein
MNNRSIKYTAVMLISLMGLNTSITLGQHGSHKYTHGKLKEYTDSLKRTPYPYVLPFFGKGAQERGFDIQRPFGVMLNVGAALNELAITRLAVSTDNVTYTDVTDIVNFTEVTPRVNIASIRPDVWVLPFLNISGLAGYYKSETNVVMDEPADMKFLAKSEGNLWGFGVMAAGGIGPFFISYQYNGTWSYNDKLFNPTFTQLNGVRIGHQRKSHRRPQTALTLWIGAESMIMSQHSRGGLNLTEIVDMTADEQQNASDQLDDWYNNLPLPRQILLEPIYDKLSGMLNDGQDAILYYDFDKHVVQKWNMLAGFQFQFNKNFMVMTEGSFLGDRWRVIVSGA